MESFTEMNKLFWVVPVGTVLKKERFWGKRNDSDKKMDNFEK